MREVTFVDGDIEVDAAILARALDLDAARIPELLRAGAITSRCERGTQQDEGRYRLTFFFADRRVRIVIGSTGQVLQTSLIDFNGRPLPDSLRRPG